MPWVSDILGPNSNDSVSRRMNSVFLHQVAPRRYVKEVVDQKELNEDSTVW